MSSPFVKSLLDMLSDFGNVRSRAMFGGHGIYHEGVMIGLIASGVFYLKVDDVLTYHPPGPRGKLTW